MSSKNLQTNKKKYLQFKNCLLQNIVVQHFSLTPTLIPIFRLESAIVLNIFNDIQQLADEYFDEHVDFFREFLCDLNRMKAKDTTSLQVDEDQIGKEAWNVFNLPSDLVDLSAYVAKSAPNEVADDEPSTSTNK